MSRRARCMTGPRVLSHAMAWHHMPDPPDSDPSDEAYDEALNAGLEPDDDSDDEGLDQ